MKITITSDCFDGAQRPLTAGSTVDAPIETAAQLVHAGRATVPDDLDRAAVRAHLRSANDKAVSAGYRGAQGARW